MTNSNIDNSMHIVLNELETQLNYRESKTEVFNRCVSERMKDVYSVQSKFLDDSVERLSSVAAFNLHDMDKLKIMCNVLKDLYKNLSVDRLKLIDTILRICED